jgi:predicted ATP-grasp superfamily ATP-dependent carboligase
MVIIPTGDLDALSISKHKNQLEQFYDIPIPEFNIASTMINKKDFYKFIATRNIDQPITHIPKDFDKLALLKKELPYPFIIKPSNSILFQQEFSKKCFAVHSKEEFENSVKKLKGKNLDVMIQEIIPGNEIYAVYMYFNKMSKPIAICGYDKLRHYPPDFGNGSFCRSKWRSQPINIASKLLADIGYQGIAEPEFIKDPRDGRYKLIEINVRTSLQNRLPAGCGLDIEYIAYLDITGQKMMNLNLPANNIEWADTFNDLLSCFLQFRNGTLGVNDILKTLLKKKIHSVAVWDDPLPLFIRLFSALRSVFSGKFIKRLRTVAK